ncbi:MAG: hypothetical protein GF329_01680 [Candidatus Lokiarchaeota archaeon]|nr:hypothetical protein [Candidatus Lokiarchaeota archaeon]
MSKLEDIIKKERSLRENYKNWTKNKKKNLKLIPNAACGGGCSSCGCSSCGCGH